MTEPSIFIWKNVLDGGMAIAYAFEKEDAIEHIIKEFRKQMSASGNNSQKTVDFHAEVLLKKLEETEPEVHGVYDGSFADYCWGGEEE